MSALFTINVEQGPYPYTIMQPLQIMTVSVGPQGYDYPPRTGEVVLFPPWQLHEVLPSKSMDASARRVTWAFNAITSIGTSNSGGQAGKLLRSLSANGLAGSVHQDRRSLLGSAPVPGPSESSIKRLEVAENNVEDSGQRGIDWDDL